MSIQCLQQTGFKVARIFEPDGVAKKMIKCEFLTLPFPWDFDVHTLCPSALFTPWCHRGVAVSYISVCDESRVAGSSGICRGGSSHPTFVAPVSCFGSAEPRLLHTEAGGSVMPIRCRQGQRKPQPCSSGLQMNSSSQRKQKELGPPNKPIQI